MSIFTSNLLTTPMSYASKFTSYVTMISYFFIVKINEFFTSPTGITQLKLFFFFPDQIIAKVFFHYFFTVFKLFKNRFNKFISSISTSKKNYWLRDFIINRNKFVIKTTNNVILIFF